MNLSDLKTLGRSGLAVSPLALGAMTFGTPRWGSPDDASEAVFDAYVSAGGNFIDTADIYAGGRSEELVGRFAAARGLRDRLVLATKSGFSAEPGNAHGGGNGRKHVVRALEGSLGRLGTEYVDLYWLHVWDTVTPAGEVLQTMCDLVRAGKVRYFGLSDVPAWYAAQMATLAAAHGVPGPVALQMPYSLVERSVEREHLACAREFGLGVTPWGPLAAGFLTGKYERTTAGAEGAGRLSGPNPYGTMLFTERNWATLDALRSAATGLGLPPAQVALAWLLGRPGVTSPIVGANSAGQLRSSLDALALALPPDVRQSLDAAGAPDLGLPYTIYPPEVARGAVFGGVNVAGWR